VVTNTGDVDAYETVQMYIGDMFSKHLVRPQRQLKDYKKVFINKGESKTVEFELSAEELAFVGQDGKWYLEEGTFTIQCDNLTAKLTCTQTTHFGYNL
ncbi:MAG: fibronectin type III-like domain-contianing protein, partial [Alistipes sp.]|nr:fibronectin type III-like domain-contianing protein [Alistipes sp.]